MTQVPFYDLGPIARAEAKELHECLDAVIAGGYFVGGPLVSDFEDKFASHIGVKHAVGVGNGLDALRLALEACKVGPGDEVIVPAFTYYATWLAITQTGATPVPVDCIGDSANIDPTAIESAINEHTKAVIAVHLYGQAADLAAILAVTDKHKLFLIEDAAQSHGAISTAGMTGSVGHASAFSFYPTKNLGALGDSGAVTTSDPAIAERIKSRRSYGQGASKYDHIDTGWNSRLDPIQAAFLTLHLSKLAAWTERRREIAGVYFDSLGGRSDSVIGPRDLSRSVWHHFVLSASDRPALQSYLKNQGIDSDAHYPYAAHELAPMRALMNSDSLNRTYPNAERLARTVTSIPMGPWMTQQQVERVAHALGEIPDNLLGEPLHKPKR
jgi:dTDP-3-amino-3,4,6-trideoxy-alpha-D-glucose transaminase